jgi:hypothetical protein
VECTPAIPHPESQYRPATRGGTAECSSAILHRNVQPMPSSNSSVTGCSTGPVAEKQLGTDLDVDRQARTARAALGVRRQRSSRASCTANSGPSRRFRIAAAVCGARLLLDSRRRPRRRHHIESHARQGPNRGRRGASTGPAEGEGHSRTAKRRMRSLAADAPSAGRPRRATLQTASVLRNLPVRRQGFLDSSSLASELETTTTAPRLASLAAIRRARGLSIWASSGSVSEPVST